MGVVESTQIPGVFCVTETVDDGCSKQGPGRLPLQKRMGLGEASVDGYHRSLGACWLSTRPCSKHKDFKEKARKEITMQSPPISRGSKLKFSCLVIPNFSIKYEEG